jgi:hypothetical protein
MHKAPRRGEGDPPHASTRVGVRLLAGAQLEPVQTQVCRTQEEVFSTGERWKAAMMEKGWT